MPGGEDHDTGRGRRLLQAARGICELLLWAGEQLLLCCIISVWRCVCVRAYVHILRS